jgi:hypothetical protein
MWASKTGAAGTALLLFCRWAIGAQCRRKYKSLPQVNDDAGGEAEQNYDGEDFDECGAGNRGDRAWWLPRRNGRIENAGCGMFAWWTSDAAASGFGFGLFFAALKFVGH